MITRRKIHSAEQYAYDVINGRIITCNLVKLACKRYFRDKVRKKRLGIYHDINSAEKSIEFFEKYLVHSKGEWSGQPFILDGWQMFILWNIFGWKNIKDGSRRFKTVYLEVARKNGKSTFLAGIGLYCFIADNEPGAECYSAAVKRDQALIIHKEATRMVKMSPELSSRIQSFRNNLSIEKTFSKFEPLGRDSDSSDGLNVHCAIVDELHAHKTRDMWDVLETATGARRQPLQVAITTAGFDRQSICWEQHEYLEKILNRVVDDETYFGMIYTIDEGDDWKDESNWHKANPGIGVSVKLDDLQRKAKKAKEITSAVNNFLRKHLDVWVQQSTRWIDIEIWNQNFTHLIDEKQYYGKKCFGGLDLSSVSDLTAWVMTFPREEDEEFIDIIARFWCPKSRLIDTTNRYRNLYEEWEREGWLTVTSGNAIDYELVKLRILDDAKKFNLFDMGVDRLFQGYQLAMELQGELGFNYVKGKKQEKVVAMGMGFMSMAPPMRELESRMLKRKINHGNNPIMRWMADNLAVKEDPAGNKKPDKAESQGKIDGIVSLLMSIDRHQRRIMKPKTIYEKRGLVIV